MSKSEDMPALIRAARGELPSDVVFRNAELFNPYTLTWDSAGFAVKHGIVVGTGSYKGIREVDLKGRRIIPGMVDAHVHIESSLLVPSEFARLAAQHGTTTVVADPHEIANVCGMAGIEYMISEREGLPIDIFFMLPSCVPASPFDQGGAVLSASDLAVFKGRPGIPGLGEMMNVPGVLSMDREVYEKIRTFSRIDGHAPLLSGKDLNAYILAGMESDHECLTLAEATEKLKKGMYIFLREGSTEKNLRDLSPLVTPASSFRCAFATDDRHVDMLVECGQIDDCVRKAVSFGVEPELALRMATLSPCLRFGLGDRGAIAPGKIADFCVLGDGKEFEIAKTYRRGMEIVQEPFVRRSCICHAMRTTPPTPAMLKIEGAGNAQVISVIPGQILTEKIVVPLDGRDIPDTTQDFLKVVVCNRYGDQACATGLVHGLGLQHGALASSVAHDAHNIIATGVSDQDIIRAISLLIGSGGGLAAVDGEATALVPLECAGLMSLGPYQEVYRQLRALNTFAESMGSVKDPFMYLAFLSLSVIPHLRISDHGLVDVDRFTRTPLFIKDKK
jgi:adenine deaminase